MYLHNYVQVKMKQATALKERADKERNCAISEREQTKVYSICYVCMYSVV